MKKQKRKISTVFGWWLGFNLAIAFTLSLMFSWAVQTRLAQNSAAELLRINLDDAKQEIIEDADQYLLSLTIDIASDLDNMEGSITADTLETLKEKYNVAEINFVDDRGIIVATTHADFLNYDMRDGPQSAEFIRLLEDDIHYYVQSYQPTSYDHSISRKYAAIVLFRGGFVQVGYDAERFQMDVDLHIWNLAHNWHVGETGFVLVAYEDWTIVSSERQDEGENLAATGLQIDPETLPVDTVFITTVYDQECYCMYDISEGYYIVSVIPRAELVNARNVSVILEAGTDIINFLVLFLQIIILAQIVVGRNIGNVNKSLAQITEGNLDTTVEVRNSREFSSLSDGINSTVTTLKKYIAEASARIDQELEFARVIQFAAMPRTFNVCDDFEIFASVDPAKEVGGDFYDFFLVDDDHLALVIADVSGKGIPGAMFMMTSKTLIKNHALLGESPAEILNHTNVQLCDGNEAELFVTVWLAILELSTGKGVAVNAGHEHPALRRAGGTYELVKYRHEPAVALDEDIQFQQHPFELRPGDSLFVYTDGIPEAHNTEGKMFGTDRMLAALNQDPDVPQKQLLETMQSTIIDFENGAPRFDDITMIGFHYLGPNKPKPEELTVEASLENLPKVMAMLNRQLESLEGSGQAKRQVKVAMEELYVNVASYAYAPESGPVTVKVETKIRPPEIAVTLIDGGVPYDPLKKSDPDISVDLDDRPIGGMGIYMVKKSMDEVAYERRNELNILRFSKKL